tara:strand:+ start:318 stop:746 length:429 start_codon:yes stop_codon:yes gene_type:complete
MDANFLRPSTEMIDKDTDLIMFQESELIGEEDIHNTLQGYELESEKQISSRFKEEPKTILDESLGDIFGKTLGFMQHSSDEYIKKVYQAETVLKEKNKDVHPAYTYLLGFGMYVSDGSNCIYLGIIFVFISVIIYFVSIVSE